jgi:hypothetical protein
MQASFNTTSITTSNGTASTTYTDISCPNTDQITATASIDDGNGIITTLTATATITLATVTRIGTGSGAGFVENTISLGAASINTGDNTTVSVNLVDSNNAPVTSLSTVTFNSTCVAANNASFTSPTVVTTSGTASTTYIDNGCLGVDFITVTLVSGNNPSAAGSLNITPLRIGTGSGASFDPGTITLGAAAITAGGNTTVTVSIVDINAALYTAKPVKIDFTSSCTGQSLASFTSPTIFTNTGTASTIYTDNGCPGSDLITVTLDNATNAPNPTAISNITINPLRIGSGTDAGFIANALNIGLASISAGGTTAVSANIVDANGALVVDFPVTVDFSSNCVTQNLATFDNASTSTIGGTASVTYTAAGTDGGCQGTDDTITATATPFAGTTLSATGTVTVASSAAGSLQFTSNSVDLIALQGTGATTGLPENATVTFTVLDGQGLPISNQTVNFTLNTTVGGITLQNIDDVSDASGLVQAVVQSGNIATSVRVTGILASNTSLTSQSGALVISTGLPDQNSFSLSASQLNPRAWNFDGTVVTITARLADRFNNPIQDGTAISFTTELGSIGSSCTTTDGACTVNWTSQNPRTTAGIATNDGRTTILATVIGEESFVDVNGNGVFDTGDSFTDLPEAFRNDDEDSAPETRDSTEPFIDFNSNIAYDGADGLFNGIQCTHPTLCSAIQTISVRDSVVLVMAEDNPTVLSVVDQDNSTYDYNGANAGINLTDTTSLIFKIVGIANVQILPVGTKIDFAATNGKITSGASHTIGNTNSDARDAANSTGEYSVFLAADTMPSNDGVLSIKVTFPNGAFVTFPPISIDDRGTIAITSPATGGSETSPTVTTFVATAADPQDGDISSSIVWTSNLDGALGTGSSINATLSIGLHTITATSTDTDSNTRSTSILRTVN